MKEKWRIISKDGLVFNVSNKGKVQVCSSRMGKFIKDLDDLEQFSKNGGHKDKQYLSTHGQYIHRLVAETWINSIPEDMEVNHLDGNKFNNEVSNLEIVTSSENHLHSWETGLRNAQQVSAEEQIRRIKIIEAEKHQREWLVLNISFETISTHKNQYEAAESIFVSRQTASYSYRYIQPILGRYFICRRGEVSELKEIFFKK